MSIECAPSATTNTSPRLPEAGVQWPTTFHPFLKLSAELQSMILSFTDLIIETSEYESVPIDLPSINPDRDYTCPCNTRNDNVFWKGTCGLCDPNEITKGLFWMSKETREEAMSIFYKGNQIVVVDWARSSYSYNGISRPSSSSEIIRKIASVPKHHLRRITRLCIDLSKLASSCFEINHRPITPPVLLPAELEEILQFIHKSFSTESLSIKFSFKLLAGSLETTRILREVCRCVSQVDLGDVSMILGADYFYEEDESGTWYTLSGADMGKDLERLWDRMGVDYYV